VVAAPRNNREALGYKSGVTDPLEELEAEGFETMFKAVATPGTVLGDLWVTAPRSASLRGS